MLSFRGTIGRGRYAALGIGLTAVKFGIDRGLAAAFGHHWRPWDYWVPATVSIRSLHGHDRWFYLALLAAALPFVWLGVALSVRRLRTVGLPVWVVVLFFVPVLNVLMFAVLVVMPEREQRREAPRPGFLDRLVPHSRWGAAAVAVAVTAAMAVGFEALSAESLRNYGWGLFVGNPFCVGLIASLLYGYHEPRSLKACYGVSVAALVLASAALILVALEGAICLLMAFPLVAPVAMIGGAVGYFLQRRPPPLATARLYCALCLALPALAGVEAVSHPPPSLVAVRTSVVVNAPPAVVWRHVVSFPPLPRGRELLLRTGIAYPTRAWIDGTGVGAIRRCVFSTGAFVEPITVWDEPRLLAFNVARQPPAMRELSPWGAIHPPHLRGFLHSRRGEFRLVALPGRRTLLVGTTWYSDRLWPAAYWRLWSDAIIHRIHRRVLDHVKRLSEQDTQR